MEQKEVKDFCNYEVYEIINNEPQTICLCKDSKTADLICKLFAEKDPKGDTYFYTNVIVPNTFVAGGGWYIGYHRNKSGKLEKTQLG